MKKIRWGLIFKLLGAVLLVWLVIGLGAPYLNANPYTERLRGSLSRALGRDVEFQKQVKFSLFNGPGFSAENVVIHEDPAIGREPIAYMDQIDVRPSIWSLLVGRFVIDSIRLEGAHINLAKSESGDWNFQSFVNRSVMSASPAIHIRDSRINFKVGDTKSVFYLMETDLDILPPGAGGGGWKVSLTGKPARTDRPAQGLGAFSLKGRWFLAPERVDLDLQLDRSGLGELSALLQGQTGNVHGTISSKLHLGGPLQDIGIVGHVQVDDVHRWDLMPAQGQGWPLDVHGRLDLIHQEIELESSTPGNASQPLALHFHASNYLSQPHWAVGANWNHFPVTPIVDLARHMGAQLPPKLDLAGVMDGAVSYSSGNLQGQVALQDASVTIPDSPPMRFDQAVIVFAGGHMRLSPSKVRTSEQDEAQLEIDYAMNDDVLDLAITAESMKVASLRAQVALAAVPWLEQIRSGEWSGQLRYHHGLDLSGWTGQLALRNAEVAVPGLADPVQLTSAKAQIEGAHVVIDRIEAQTGNCAFTGSYSYEPGAARPHKLHIRAATLDAADLQASFMPTLRRNPGLLARALGRASVPDWLEQRMADGTVQIDKFTVASAQLDNVRAHLLWDVARVQLDVQQAKLAGSNLTGTLVANLRGTRPAYKFEGKLKGFAWQGGKLDAAGVMETSGTGLGLATALVGEGTFTGTGIDFGGVLGRSISGNYAVNWAGNAPHVRLTGINLRAEDDVFTGRGATQDDGRMLLVLSSGAKEIRLAGPLDKLKVEEAKQ